MSLIQSKIDKYYILDTLRKNKNVLKGLGVRRIGLFGSYVLDKQRDDSDIDLLIDNNVDNYLNILDYLNNLFPGFTIELTDKKNIKDEYKRNILGTVVYAAGNINKRLTEIEKKIKEKPELGEKDYAIYFKQMKDKINEVMDSMKNVKSFDEFNNNMDKKNAVNYNLIVLGNISKKIMDLDRDYGAGILDTRKGIDNKDHKFYQDIDLSAIYGNRNVIDHGYNKVDYGKVYKVATDDIPELKKKVDRAVEELSLKEENKLQTDHEIKHKIKFRR
ncbi:MAG: HepT-like ribonuclease domain-containing protein [bacterium]